MGGHNAVDVAQLTHEDLLKRAGAEAEEVFMRYGQPLRGRVFQGVYVDGHIIMGVVPKHLANDPKRQ